MKTQNVECRSHVQYVTDWNLEQQLQRVLMSKVPEHHTFTLHSIGSHLIGRDCWMVTAKLSVIRGLECREWLVGYSTNDGDLISRLADVDTKPVALVEALGQVFTFCRVQITNRFFD